MGAAPDAAGSVSAYLRDSSSRASAAASFTPSRHGATGMPGLSTWGSATRPGTDLLGRPSAAAATPAAERHSSLLATPLSRNAGGRVGQVRTSLLDEHMAAIQSQVAVGRQPAPSSASKLAWSPAQRQPLPFRQPLTPGGVGGAVSTPGSSSLHALRKEDPYLLGWQAAGSAARAAAPADYSSVHARLRQIEAEAKARTWEGQAQPVLPGSSQHAGGGSDFKIPARHGTPGVAAGVAAAAARADSPTSITVRLSRVLDDAAFNGASSAKRYVLGTTGRAAGLEAGAAYSPAASSPQASPSFSTGSGSTSSGAKDGSSSLAGLSRNPQSATAQQLPQQGRDDTSLLQESHATPADAAWSAACSADVHVLMSRVRQLEAQVAKQAMDLQDGAAAQQELQQRLGAAEERAEQQGSSAAVARQLQQRAEVQRQGAEVEAAALQEEVGRRQSAHADNTEAVTRLQAVAQVQRQESEELRGEVCRLSALLDEQLARGSQLQASLIQSQTCASNDAASLQAQINALEAQHQTKLEEAHHRAAVEAAQQERRVQLADINLEAARQEVAKARKEGEARCHELQQAVVVAQRAALAAEEQADAAAEQAKAGRKEVQDLQEQLGGVRGELRRAEEALTQEREHGSVQAQHAREAQQSEAALTAQLKAMAAQLQQLQEEAAGLRADRVRLEEGEARARAAAQTEVAVAEGRVEAALAERDAMEARLGQARDELARQAAALEQQQGVVTQLGRAREELQGVVRDHEASIMARNQQLVATHEDAERARAEGSLLRQQLRDAKAALAKAEDQLVRAGWEAGRGGASPLREVVASLQAELAEREAALVQAQEDLARERTKGADLQRQLLQQAVELDDVQHELSDSVTTRQQLATTRQAEAKLRRRVAELQQQVAAAPPSSSSPRSDQGSPSALREAAAAARREAAATEEEAGRLRAEVTRLRGEGEARELEVMQLQGQLRQLHQTVTDAENWLMMP